MSQPAPENDAQLQSAKPTSFEAVVERLEEIANRLEGGEANLEEALALFEEGVQLAKRGNLRLDEAERRLEVLLENGQTQPTSDSPNGPLLGGL